MSWHPGCTGHVRRGCPGLGLGSAAFGCSVLFEATGWMSNQGLIGISGEELARVGGRGSMRWAGGLDPSLSCRW